MTQKEKNTFENLQTLILTSERQTGELADMLKLVADMKAAYMDGAGKTGTLNERMTFADMVRAVDKWYDNGSIQKTLRDNVKEALSLAFQIACAEYLTSKTEFVCGNGL